MFYKKQYKKSFFCSLSLSLSLSLSHIVQIGYVYVNILQNEFFFQNTHVI